MKKTLIIYKPEFQDLIDVLETLPPDAKVVCDGDEWFWVHVSSDLTEVDIDSSALDYTYDDNDDDEEAEES